MVGGETESSGLVGDWGYGNMGTGGIKGTVKRGDASICVLFSVLCSLFHASQKTGQFPCLLPLCLL